ncbi:cbb3-type cytochrome c oxidase subunit II [Chitinimonas sp.]|uniref:cbb3-type cytochrome c oxidase subunit II n=1 Tax=Chitinimonas sp. TaxID=1934313 RepID=UPI002F94588F
MHSETKLLVGSSVILSIAITALVVLPYLQEERRKPPSALRPYTDQQLRGRQVYIENGCIACHSQQPRTRAQAPDFERGWGRAPVAADYYYDKPILLGTMRTGPDLFNIGARQPSVDWHLGHLYQPRAYTAGSIMPAYPFLFERKAKAETGETLVNLPPAFAPKGEVVVAKPAAMDLVAYLLALDHTYALDDIPSLPVPAPTNPAPAPAPAGGV